MRRCSTSSRVAVRGDVVRRPSAGRARRRGNPLRARPSASDARWPRTYAGRARVTEARRRWARPGAGAVGFSRNCHVRLRLLTGARGVERWDQSPAMGSGRAVRVAWHGVTARRSPRSRDESGGLGCPVTQAPRRFGQSIRESGSSLRASSAPIVTPGDDDGTRKRMFQVGSRLERSTRAGAADPLCRQQEQGALLPAGESAVRTVVC
jgi:hypothetical protein